MLNGFSHGSAISRAVTQAAVNQAAAAVSRLLFFSAGAYMGQGLAAGLNSALGAVTAANALVAQAERVAQAKAKFTQLFRDQVVGISAWYRSRYRRISQRGCKQSRLYP